MQTTNPFSILWREWSRMQLWSMWSMWRLSEFPGEWQTLPHQLVWNCARYYSRTCSTLYRAQSGAAGCILYAKVQLRVHRMPRCQRIGRWAYWPPLSHTAWVMLHLLRKRSCCQFLLPEAKNNSWNVPPLLSARKDWLRLIPPQRLA